MAQVQLHTAIDTEIPPRQQQQQQHYHHHHDIQQGEERQEHQHQQQQQQQQKRRRQQQQRQPQVAQNDDSWARTPPGGPQVTDKQTAMDLDAAVVSLSPAVPILAQYQQQGYGQEPEQQQTQQQQQQRFQQLVPPSMPKSIRSAATHGFALDDLEAAETLAGFARQSSPPTKHTTPSTPFPTYHHPLPGSSAAAPSSSTSTNTPPVVAPHSQPQPEPLLSLLTSQHPLIGSAINGSLSAYNVGKTYSSQFRYGAEFVERNIATPVASTVGTAGRITGVESGVRRWLSRGRSSQSDAASSNSGTPVTPELAASMSPSPSNQSHKRRREENELELEPPVQPAQRSRAASEISLPQGEFLPAYDANRSPTYSTRDPYPPLSPQQHSLGNSTWQTRLILSTSGLGVAMSGESRRSLKYCLTWLRWGNGRLGRLVFSLQTLLVEYEAAGHRRQQGNGNDTAGASSQAMQLQRPRDRAAITAQLAAIRSECEKVLKKSVDVVSQYTGGALPENARALVHRHLTSLPQRFAFALRGEREVMGDDEDDAATTSAAATAATANTGAGAGLDNSMSVDGPNVLEPNRNSLDIEAQAGISEAEQRETQRRRETVRAARRMVVLAREGLEMMGQVSLVVDSTIKSAEEWCERLGRRVPENEDAELSAAVNGSLEPAPGPDSGPGPSGSNLSSQVSSPEQPQGQATSSARSESRTMAEDDHVMKG